MKVPSAVSPRTALKLCTFVASVVEKVLSSIAALFTNAKVSPSTSLSSVVWLITVNTKLPPSTAKDLPV